ncbi:MAG: hypothetical protein FRX48_01845 [Lasallia pustulata]|uniref:Uncharacterized protein n=1 Tax=Lasallia pustulata TaxID=136370 RepID=A0A5M8PZC0_9LECA|nr:MAG: hypothetical protein FRX48_01845 [Lasallia pustulata]
MQIVFTLSALLTLLPLASLSLAVLPPTDNSPPSLSRRQIIQYCYNGPTTIPGAPFTTHPEVIPELPTSDPLTWCTPNTRTYITLLYTRPLPNAHAWSTIQHVIDAAFAISRAAISAGGDRVIQTGQWVHADLGVQVAFMNTNNHQMTYGVLSAALVGVEGWMQMTQAAGGGRGRYGLMFLMG